MNIDETTLRAYVDGELDAHHRGAVQAALHGSAQLQADLGLFLSSSLPYQKAFDAQALPEVPHRLWRQVSAWAGEPAVASQADYAGRRRLIKFGAGIAAAFAAGLWAPVPWRIDPAVYAADRWVRVIARYQALYVRETVDFVAVDPKRARELLVAFAQDLGVDVSVPDLGTAGLIFRGLQRLAVDDSPVIQMVYLPHRGKPAALCVRPDPGRVVAVTTHRIEGLGVASWRRNGLAYVMVADLPIEDAAMLAERVASGELPVLYGSGRA
jgi:anti-sigma factor RsiW